MTGGGEDVDVLKFLESKNEEYYFIENVWVKRSNIVVFENNRIAFYNPVLETLTMYFFNGTELLVVGKNLYIPISGSCSISKYGDNGIFFWDGFLSELRCMVFDDDNLWWGQQGRALFVSNVIKVEATLTATEENKVLLSSDNYSETFIYDGEDFHSEQKVLSITSVKLFK